MSDTWYPDDVVRTMKMKILRASRDGDVDELRRLIHGSNAAARPIFDDAILEACENGHTEAVRLLLEHSADPGYMEHFRTLLGRAFPYGHADLVRILIEDYGVAVDDGVAESMIAAIVSDSGSFRASGQLEIVRILLSRGASPNTTKASGFEAGASVLWLAVHADRIEIARALIEAGAEVDFKGPRGVTPLLKAVWSGRLAMARLLLDCSSSSIDWACDRHVNSPRVQVPSTVDGGTVSLGGSTPLSAACLTGKAGLVRLLLQRGARPATALSWPTLRADGKYAEPVLDMLRQYYAVHVTLDVWGRRERRRDIVPRIIPFLVPPRV